MKPIKGLRHQNGATLIVGLIMLVLITLLMVSAFTSSSGNLKAVGNMQSRDEAIAAANSAMEKVIELDFTNLNAAQPYAVDIDQNTNTPAYQVAVTVVGCKSATPAAPSDAALSGETSGIANTGGYDTVWELEAEVVDETTGTSVTAIQGVRKRLTQAEWNSSTCK